MGICSIVKLNVYVLKRIEHFADGLHMKFCHNTVKLSLHDSIVNRLLIRCSACIVQLYLRFALVLALVFKHDITTWIINNQVHTYYNDFFCSELKVWCNYHLETMPIPNFCRLFYYKQAHGPKRSKTLHWLYIIRVEDNAYSVWWLVWPSLSNPFHGGHEI